MKAHQKRIDGQGGDPGASVDKKTDEQSIAPVEAIRPAGQWLPVAVSSKSYQTGRVFTFIDIPENP